MQDLSYMFDMNMYTYLGMCLTMTYLRKYAYTSLGMSFLMGAFAQVYLSVYVYLYIYLHVYVCVRVCVLYVCMCV